MPLRPCVKIRIIFSTNPPASARLDEARLNPRAVEPLCAVATIALRRGRPVEERAAILRALERQPDSVFAWVKLMTFEYLRGNTRALRRASLRALALDPRNPGLIGLARRAQSALFPPEESATATGSPLPTRVPVTTP